MNCSGFGFRKCLKSPKMNKAVVNPFKITKPLMIIVQCTYIMGLRPT